MPVTAPGPHPLSITPPAPPLGIPLCYLRLTTLKLNTSVGNGVGSELELH
jgi:hypothetical protein